MMARRASSPARGAVTCQGAPFLARGAPFLARWAPFLARGAPSLVKGTITGQKAPVKNGTDSPHCP